MENSYMSRNVTFAVGYVRQLTKLAERELTLKHNL